MKILIADDDNVSRILLHRLLSRWGYDSIEVEDGEKALQIMASEEAPDLVLLDWEMPKADGPEVCRQLRLMNKPIPPYIIFVTAKDTLFDLVLGLEMGASDFIRKPYKQEELRARIQVGFRTVALQTELVQARNQMEHLAMYDLLTDVHNRRAVTDLLPLEFKRAVRSGLKLWVALADLDHFKKLNDTYGHHVGDQALVEFARILRSSTRETDVIGRWDGEEFILAAATEEGAEPKLFERIRRNVEASCLELDNKKVTFTVSIGATDTDGSESVDKVLRRADEALYEAKAGGRNKVVFFNFSPQLVL